MEWTRLKGRPYDYDEELQLVGVSAMSANSKTVLDPATNPLSKKASKQWFALRSNRRTKKATRAAVKICCKKLQSAFGTFVDRTNGAGPVLIFPKSSGLTGQASRGINFCPWCGKESQFLQSEDTNGSRARTAKAGARD